MQCRVTTEDPANNFLPDYGRLSHYRSASGMGIRLDAGTAFAGAVITPFYDSLLVKVTAHGLRFVDAARRMERCLQEFRVRGVKTNIPFLHQPGHAPGLSGRRLHDALHRRDAGAVPVAAAPGPGDQAADATSARSSSTAIPRSKRQRGTRHSERDADRDSATGSPRHRRFAAASPPGTRDKFHELGPEKFAPGCCEQKRLLLTDTTFRDAHQSLLATRMRTYDMLQIAPVYAARHAGLFSLEMWGGATFDTSMRFLKESPWERLAELRERMPNILFQMLLRAANAVGYTNYPDNVVKAFVKESAQAGIDLFRIFDALNWLPNLKLAIEAVRNTRHAVRGGHLLHRRHPRPEAAEIQPDVLRRPGQGTGEAGRQPAGHQGHGRPVQAVRRPAAGASAEAGNRHADPLPHARFRRRPDGVAADGGRGGRGHRRCGHGAAVRHDQPAELERPGRGAALHAARHRPGLRAAARRRPTTGKRCAAITAPFESGQLAASADVYRHEMPGGQYTNLYQQAQALGLATAGTKSAGCTPRSTGCSATSSR